MTARLGSVSLDCDDPHALAVFYSGLTGKDVAYEADGFSAIHLAPGFWLSFQRSEGYRAPEWPDGEVATQAHLDFAVEDLEAGESDAVAAGARKADVQPSPDRWRVMLDPAGHPFCLTTLIPE